MVVLDILILIGIVSYVLYKLNRSGLVGQQGPQSSAQKNVSVKKKSVSGNPKGENFIKDERRSLLRIVRRIQGIF